MSERRRRTMGERGAPPDPIRNIRWGLEEPSGDVPAWRQNYPAANNPPTEPPTASSGKPFWQRIASLLPWVHDDEPEQQSSSGPFLNGDSVNTHGSERSYRLVISFDTGSWQPTGVLREMGYKVGKQGLSTTERREILRRVYSVELVAGSADAQGYVREWGPPASTARLAKMVNSIAAFSRNAKRRNTDYSEAIADWEEDLDWLTETYS
ncbi:hypothetical protein [Mycolicibacterium sp. S3B2]|uniref:hypothetical protein n=1 Tax=Mycolicibacterium sp. S3B2 TaxID=3415120 RepID=UPI003C7BBB93